MKKKNNFMLGLFVQRSASIQVFEGGIIDGGGGEKGGEIEGGGGVKRGSGGRGEFLTSFIFKKKLAVFSFSSSKKTLSPRATVIVFPTFLSSWFVVKCTVSTLVVSPLSSDVVSPQL